MKKHTLSIAMATYNGEKYLSEQLASFLSQSIRPDELVICDDGSTDSTLNLLREFKAEADFDVIIVENENNLGYAKNFEKVISLCTGDVIFLSDQDDIWLPDKLNNVNRVFLDHKDINVVINNQYICDNTMLKQGSVTSLTQEKSFNGSYDLFVIGCCTAIRQTWLDVVLPFPLNWPLAHDDWIAFLSIESDCRYLMEEPLQLYRRHESNVSNAKTSDVQYLDIYQKIKGKFNQFKGGSWKLEPLIFLCIYERLSIKFSDEIYREKFVFSENRFKEMSKPFFLRIGFILSALVSRKYQFARGWKSIIKDLLIINMKLK